MNPFFGYPGYPSFAQSNTCACNLHALIGLSFTEEGSFVEQFFVPPDLKWNGGFLCKNCQNYVKRQREVVDAALSSEISYSSLEGTKKIGSGSFGNVFKATWKGKTVAVKQIRQIQDTHSHLFVIECGLFSEISHPNCVKYFGWSKSPFCLITEFEENGDLATYTHNNPHKLSFDDKKRIALGIAQGLKYLHSLQEPKIIHGNLKPQNVLLDKNMVPKLVDFQCMKFRMMFTSMQYHTNNAVAIYYAPEIFMVITASSDIYSFGMVLYELYVEKPPFHDQVQNTPNIFQSIMSGTRPTLPPNFEAPDLLDIMKGCWHATPELRTPLDEVISALENMKEPVITSQTPSISASITTSALRFDEVVVSDAQWEQLCRILDGDIAWKKLGQALEESLKLTTYDFQRLEHTYKADFRFSPSKQLLYMWKIKQEATASKFLEIVNQIGNFAAFSLVTKNQQ